MKSHKYAEGASKSPPTNLNRFMMYYSAQEIICLVMGGALGKMV